MRTVCRPGIQGALDRWTNYPKGVLAGFLGRGWVPTIGTVEVITPLNQCGAANRGPTSLDNVEGEKPQLRSL